LPGEEKRISTAEAKQGEENRKSLNKEEVKELAQDILPVHTSMKTLAPSRHLMPSAKTVWLVLCGPLFIYMVTFILMRFRKKTARALTAANAKRAPKDFVKQCRNGPLSAGEFTQAVSAYLNARFGIPPGAITPDETGEILKSKGVKPQTVHRFQALLQGSVDAVYMGKGNEIFQLNEDLGTLLKQIEKEVR
jgi:hypothetical protein